MLFYERFKRSDLVRYKESRVMASVAIFFRPVDLLRQLVVFKTIEIFGSNEIIQTIGKIKE